MVSDELLEEIRAQADITQIVGEYVQLRRSGRTYRGPCPLHGGEGPNFSVDPERGMLTTKTGRSLVVAARGIVRTKSGENVSMIRLNRALWAAGSYGPGRSTFARRNAE